MTTTHISLAVAGSTLVSSLPSIQTSLLLRGGAVVVGVGASHLVTSTLDKAVAVSGGGNQSNDFDGNVNILGISFTPQGRSVICMAIAMSLHYLGYSFARPSTLALFTSASTGYSSPAAFPLAMACVSPTALLLLLGYGRVLDRYGPKGALKRTSFFCAFVLSFAAAAIVVLKDSTILSIPAVKYVTGPLFVFRESYVQLLTSQYWSFMASVLTPRQAAQWFAPISGLTSITSALAGLSVSTIVQKLGLPGALVLTSLMTVLSVVASSKAYGISERFDFDPAEEIQKKAAAKNKRQKRGKKIMKANEEIVEKHPSLIKKAADLFARVPQLWLLFLEILSSQGLATLLNVCFVTRLSTAIPNDRERAGWMGKFFALINVISMTIQFGVLPPIMTVLEPRDLWRTMPLILMCFTTYQSLQSDPSLHVVSASLLVMKTLEYSVRRMLDEMVYVPLDFESRFVGKEVIGVFGYRFGKSSMSLFLSALTAIFGNFSLQDLSWLCNGASFLWLTCAWRLSNLVPTRKEAEEKYQQAHSKDGKKKKRRVGR